MEIFYFLVTGSKAWTNNFHENFFNEQGGFMLGFLGALFIGTILAGIFYFGLCNSKKSAQYANINIWLVAMLLSAIVSYFFADLVVIGDSKTTDKDSLFRKYSFYQANEVYYIIESRKPGASPTYEKDLFAKKDDIKGKLDKGKDVRFDFDITTAVLAILFFFIVSIIVKRFTINGKGIPFIKP